MWQTRFVFFLALLCLLAASPVWATSFSLTSGHVVLSGFEEMSMAEFRGPGASLTGVNASDFGSTFGIHSCGLCTLDYIRDLRIPLAILPPDGVLLSNHARVSWLDGAVFKAVSFHASFDPNGTLTVSGGASAHGDFRIGNGDVFLLDDYDQWRYLAHYRPATGLPGYYVFWDAQIYTVPEPATVWLFAAGSMFAGRFRRRRG